ncbi:MAG: LysR substrate-binding domain-containing protein [Pseudomonadota bacterium]
MESWLPSLNALRAFETVARHLNYRKAAEELSVSPAAVKQLVRKLEETMGTALLERRGRGLALTETGAAALHDLSRGFRQIIDAVETMRHADGGGRLIVTSDPSFAAVWLVPRLESFKADNPGIDVLVDSSTQIADLRSGAADIAIRFGVPRDESLHCQRLFDETFAAYCSPSLANGEPGLRRIEDLERVPLLRWDLSQSRWASVTAQWNSWRHWLGEVGAPHVRPSHGLRFSDYNLALQAAIAGQGVVLGSAPILRDLVDAKLLVNPLPQIAVTDIGYDLVTTPGAVARPEVARFRDWIVAQSSS